MSAEVGAEHLPAGSVIALGTAFECGSHISLLKRCPFAPNISGTFPRAPGCIVAPPLAFRSASGSLQCKNFITICFMWNNMRTLHGPLCFLRRAPLARHDDLRALSRLGNGEKQNQRWPLGDSVTSLDMATRSSGQRAGNGDSPPAPKPAIALV
jgi:hypothetical protein